MDSDDPLVSFVIPARNEAELLGATLGSIAALDPSPGHEVIVVDGDSTDDTASVAREWGATVVDGPCEGPGPARHRGARVADGEWLAFLDADTRVRPEYLESMLAFVREQGLAAAGARCRIDGPKRAKPFELLFSYVLPLLSPPVIPGFHLFVAREAYVDAGGFSAGPNEDVTFSRRLGRDHRVGVHPEVLVETSGRRIAAYGFVGAVRYYARLEWERQRAQRRQ